MGNDIISFAFQKDHWKEEGGGRRVMIVMQKALRFTATLPSLLLVIKDL